MRLLSFSLFDCVFNAVAIQHAIAYQWQSTKRSVRRPSSSLNIFYEKKNTPIFFLSCWEGSFLFLSKNHKSYVLLWLPSQTHVVLNRSAFFIVSFFSYICNICLHRFSNQRTDYGDRAVIHFIALNCSKHEFQVIFLFLHRIFGCSWCALSLFFLRFLRILLSLSCSFLLFLALPRSFSLSPSVSYTLFLSLVVQFSFPNKICAIDEAVTKITKKNCP